MIWREIIKGNYSNIPAKIFDTLITFGKSCSTDTQSKTDYWRPHWKSRWDLFIDYSA